MIKLPLLEYDIVWHCNLNCRNCSHFSQFKDVGEKSIKQFEEEIQLLRSKFEVTRFKLCGGEPLLHSNIYGIISAARRIMGNETRIVLASNGIKFSSMKESFLLALKHYQIEFHVTEYSINVDYDKMEKILKDREILYSRFAKTMFRDMVDPTGTQNPDESFSICQGHRCPFFDGKTFWSCAYAANVPFINKKLGYKIECNGISANESAEAIEAYINAPSSTCRFCRVGKVLNPWRIEDKELIDKVKAIPVN